MKVFDPDIQVMTNGGIEEKIAVQNALNMRVAARTFLEESVKLAGTLPAKKKCLFYMRFDHGFTIKEIAEVCHVPESEVSRRLKEIVEEINKMRNCCRKGPNRHDPKNRAK